MHKTTATGQSDSYSTWNDVTQLNNTWYSTLLWDSFFFLYANWTWDVTDTDAIHTVQRTVRCPGWVTVSWYCRSRLCLQRLLKPKVPWTAHTMYTSRIVRYCETIHTKMRCTPKVEYIGNEKRRVDCPPAETTGHATDSSQKTKFWWRY